nr:putative DNA polymerase [Picea sitchensis]
MPFLVADTETVLVDGVHVPYAAGFLPVYPGEDVDNYSIYTEFSEDSLSVLPSFEDRSDKMLYDFLERLARVAEKYKIPMVYFHNLSRFDGILLIKFYAKHGNTYSIKPLMRNLRLYELVVSRGNKVVLRLRDSLALLPGSLDTLAKTLCPQLGGKGSIPHEEIQVETLENRRDQLLEYLKQDIRLLGGVMLKAQEIYWTQFKVDIVKCLTVSSLAMKIYRMSFYDPNSFPIHLPSKNEDTFIRRGYYGGHSDMYIPYGENLYYYDVNSLYPYIMKTFNMPGGKPVWHGDLQSQELSNLYGFIEAYVVCPSTITRPFLPYKANNTLLFATGKFVGVYYSEELKYARDLGYTIIPLRGYLFEERTSPFGSFVSELFSRRQEAKVSGHDAMAYVYKILMNSLYGRFGINPQSTITEVVNRERYDTLTQNENLIFGDKLSDHYYIVSYLSNTGQVDDLDWNPPSISAVQLAAAITACARIHMYNYTSRPDCYYTDTDSAVLGSPLPEDEVSSIELGKCKLEYTVKQGIFLAAKSYSLLLEEDKGHILKQKGPTRSLVSPEWYKLQLENPSLTQQMTLASNFRINWHTLEISKKDTPVVLGIKVDTKRFAVYSEEGVWVSTKPKNVIDFGGQDSTILKIENKILQEQLDEKEKESAKKDAQLDVLAHQIAGLSDQNEKIQKSYASMREENASMREENASMHEDIKDYLDRLMGFDSQNFRLCEENASLKEQLADLAKKMDTFKESHFGLMEAYNELIENNQKLNKLLQDKDAKLDDLREENAINAKRIDLLSKMMDDQAKIMDNQAKTTIAFNARIYEEIQKLNKLLQDKDAKLDDLREMNASLIKENNRLKEKPYLSLEETKSFHKEHNKQLLQIIKRKNEEIARLEAKLGQTTKLPTQDTNKPKEPSWWKEKERMDNRNKPKKPPGSKGYHNGAFYKPPP